MPFGKIGSAYPKASTDDDMPLVTFDGEPGTTVKFRQMNDPVMVRTKYIVKI